MPGSDDHPYSLVFESNGTVYVSGATSIDYATGTPIGGRREALEATLDEVERRLASVGLGLRHVVKVTYYLADISLRAEANEQFQQRFAQPRPARTVVGVSGIPYGGTVVIDAIASR